MMRLLDENQVIQRRAGIVWKNLKVCGSGSAINLQKNVGSLLLAPLRFGEFFGRGPEKTILNEFDGVLKSGEMLVVLGRPGSGCSTLLKSLMGELAGLDMKPQSEIHYNGNVHPLFLFPSRAQNFPGPGGSKFPSLVQNANFNFDICRISY
jgi:ATP-binding cassette, subfamily G (WHITE), member 2, PDR